MQTLKITTTVQIPEDHILISKIEFDNLQQQQLLGKYWSMKELEERINKKNEWIKENILFPNAFKKKLDIENGGFVYYPKKKGETWSFHASKMALFLDENFNQIFAN